MNVTLVDCVEVSLLLLVRVRRGEVKVSDIEACDQAYNIRGSAPIRYSQRRFS